MGLARRVGVRIVVGLHVPAAGRRLADPLAAVADDGADVDDAVEPRRIVVLGGSCSGKSTLAQRLASSLGAPYVELDALYWRREWTPAPVEEFLAALDEVAAGERWVAAGNYRSRAQVTTWPRAELFVEDKLHMNEKGYAIWKQIVAPYLK